MSERWVQDLLHTAAEMTMFVDAGLSKHRGGVVRSDQAPGTHDGRTKSSPGLLHPYGLFTRTPHINACAQQHMRRLLAQFYDPDDPASVWEEHISSHRWRQERFRWLCQRALPIPAAGSCGCTATHSSDDGGNGCGAGIPGGSVSHGTKGHETGAGSACASANAIGYSSPPLCLCKSRQVPAWTLPPNSGSCVRIEGVAHAVLVHTSAGALLACPWSSPATVEPVLLQGPDRQRKLLDGTHHRVGRLCVQATGCSVVIDSTVATWSLCRQGRQPALVTCGRELWTGASGVPHDDAWCRPAIGPGDDYNPLSCHRSDISGAYTAFFKENRMKPSQQSQQQQYWLRRPEQNPRIPRRHAAVAHETSGDRDSIPPAFTTHASTATGRPTQADAVLRSGASAAGVVLLTDSTHMLVYTGPPLGRAYLLRAIAFLWDWHVGVCAPRKAEQLQVAGGCISRSTTPAPDVLELAVFVGGAGGESTTAPPLYSVVRLLMHDRRTARVAWRTPAGSPQQATVPSAALWAYTSIYRRPNDRPLSFDRVLSLLEQCAVRSCELHLRRMLAGAATVNGAHISQRIVRTGHTLDRPAPLASVTTAASHPEDTQLLMVDRGHPLVYTPSTGTMEFQNDRIVTSSGGFAVPLRGWNLPTAFLQHPTHRRTLHIPGHGASSVRPDRALTARAGASNQCRHGVSGLVEGWYVVDEQTLRADLSATTQTAGNGPKGKGSANEDVVAGQTPYQQWLERGDILAASEVLRRAATLQAVTRALLLFFDNQGTFQQQYQQQQQQQLLIDWLPPTVCRIGEPCVGGTAAGEHPPTLLLLIPAPWPHVHYTLVAEPPRQSLPPKSVLEAVRNASPLTRNCIQRFRRAVTKACLSPAHVRAEPAPLPPEVQALLARVGVSPAASHRSDDDSTDDDDTDDGDEAKSAFVDTCFGFRHWRSTDSGDDDGGRGEARDEDEDDWELPGTLPRMLWARARPATERRIHVHAPAQVHAQELSFVQDQGLATPDGVRLARARPAAGDAAVELEWLYVRMDREEDRLVPPELLLGRWQRVGRQPSSRMPITSVALECDSAGHVSGWATIFDQREQAQHGENGSARATTTETATPAAAATTTAAAAAAAATATVQGDGGDATPPPHTHHHAQQQRGTHGDDHGTPTTGTAVRGGHAHARPQRAPERERHLVCRGRRVGDLLLIVLDHAFTNVPAAGLALRYHPEGFLQGTYTRGSIMEPVLFRPHRTLPLTQVALGTTFAFGRASWARVLAAEMKCGDPIPTHTNHTSSANNDDSKGTEKGGGTDDGDGASESDGDRDRQIGSSMMGASQWRHLATALLLAHASIGLPELHPILTYARSWTTDKPLPPSTFACQLVASCDGLNWALALVPPRGHAGAGAEEDDDQEEVVVVEEHACTQGASFLRTHKPENPPRSCDLSAVSTMFPCTHGDLDEVVTVACVACPWLLAGLLDNTDAAVLTHVAQAVCAVALSVPDSAAVQGAVAAAPTRTATAAVPSNNQGAGTNTSAQDETDGLLKLPPITGFDNAEPSTPRRHWREGLRRTHTVIQATYRQLVRADAAAPHILASAAEAVHQLLQHVVLGLPFPDHARVPAHANRRRLAFERATLSAWIRRGLHLGDGPAHAGISDVQEWAVHHAPPDQQPPHSHDVQQPVLPQQDQRHSQQGQQDSPRPYHQQTHAGDTTSPSLPASSSPSSGGQGWRTTRAATEPSEPLTLLAAAAHDVVLDTLLALLEPDAHSLASEHGVRHGALQSRTSGALLRNHATGRLSPIDSPFLPKTRLAASFVQLLSPSLVDAGEWLASGLNLMERYLDAGRHVNTRARSFAHLLGRRPERGWWSAHSAVDGISTTVPAGWTACGGASSSALLSAARAQRSRGSSVPDVTAGAYATHGCLLDLFMALACMQASEPGHLREALLLPSPSLNRPDALAANHGRGTGASITTATAATRHTTPTAAAQQWTSTFSAAEAKAVLGGGDGLVATDLDHSHGHDDYLARPLAEAMPVAAAPQRLSSHGFDTLFRVQSSEVPSFSLAGHMLLSPDAYSRVAEHCPNALLTLANAQYATLRQRRHHHLASAARLTTRTAAVQTALRREQRLLRRLDVDRARVLSQTMAALRHVDNGHSLEIRFVGEEGTGDGVLRAWAGLVSRLLAEPLPLSAIVDAPSARLSCLAYRNLFHTTPSGSFHVPSWGHGQESTVAVAAVAAALQLNTDSRAGQVPSPISAAPCADSCDAREVAALLLARYEDVGRFLGQCIKQRQVVSLRLARHVWKLVLQRPLRWHDVAFLDRDRYTGLCEIMRAAQQQQQQRGQRRQHRCRQKHKQGRTTYSAARGTPLTAQDSAVGASGAKEGDNTGETVDESANGDADIVALYGLTFSYSWRTPFSTCDVQLVRNGHNTDVVGATVLDYMRRFTLDVLGACAPACDALRRGLFSTVDASVFDSMSVEDIWMTLNGGGATAVSLDQVLQHLKVVDRRSNEEDMALRPLAQFNAMLVECLSTMSGEELSELVCFVTGSPQLLGAGLDDTTGVAWTQLVVHVQDESCRLPQAQNCFSQVFIPFYSDANTMATKLRMAMQTQEFGLA